MRKLKAEAVFNSSVKEGMSAELFEDMHGDVLAVVDVKHFLWDILNDLSDLRETVELSDRMVGRLTHRLQAKITEYLKNADI